MARFCAFEENQKSKEYFKKEIVENKYQK